MNLLEHYIKEVVSVEDVTNKYPEIFDIVNEPIYEIKLIVNCYGNKQTVQVMWHKTEYETNLQRGYYFA